MKWKKMLSGAGVLAVCAVLAKLLGALYRIPLTNTIGAEGMGLYQMVFPLYTVLLTVSSGGLSGAISKVVAASLAKNDQKGATKTLKVSLISLLALSGVSAVFLIIFRGRIAALQGNADAAPAYLGIAPAVVLVAGISSFRGYFQGRGNMLPSGLSQIIEQLFKLILGLQLAAALAPRGIPYAVFGAVMGVTLSELAALVVLLVQFGFHYHGKKRLNFVSVRRINLGLEAASDFAAPPAFAPLKTGEILKNLYRIAIPVTLGSLIMPLTQVIDSILVINVLTAGGVARDTATSLFGLVSGPVSSLVNMPVAVTLSISVALLPKIAYIREKGKDAGAATAGAIRLTLLMALPAAALFMFFPHQIVSALYSRGLSDWQRNVCASLLRIESLSVLYIGLIQICTSVLQGADKPHRPALNLLCGAVVKVMLTLVLLPFFGIRGAAAASVACYAVIALLDMIFALRVVRPVLSLKKVLIMPLLGCAAMIGVCFAGLWACSLLGLTPMLAAVVSFLLGAGVYAVFLLVTKTLKVKEVWR